MHFDSRACNFAIYFISRNGRRKRQKEEKFQLGQFRNIATSAAGREKPKNHQGEAVKCPNEQNETGCVEKYYI